MSQLRKTIRMWKDEEFRHSLSDQERTSLPDHPAGLIELDAADLNAVTGGLYNPTIRPCGSYYGLCSTRCGPGF